MDAPDASTWTVLKSYEDSITLRWGYPSGPLGKPLAVLYHADFGIGIALPCEDAITDQSLADGLATIRALTSLDGLAVEGRRHAAE